MFDPKIYEEYKKEEEKEFLRQTRQEEQKALNDYSYHDNGEIERCTCGAYINSHGYCPRCDY